MKSGHFTPAVEFMQGQRLRHIVMRQFADAVGKYDVYAAPFINARVGPVRSNASGYTSAGGTTSCAKSGAGALSSCQYLRLSRPRCAERVCRNRSADKHQVHGSPVQ